MKKILAIILCIVLSLGCLVGCSSFNEETEETKEIFGFNETGKTIPLSESTVIKDINSKIQKLIGEVDASKENKEEVSKDIARLQCNTNALFRNDKKLESKDEELSKKDEEFEVISNDLKAVTDVLKEKAENFQSEIEELKVTDEKLAAKDNELAAKDVELDEAITSIWETLPKILNDFFNWRVKPELKKLEMNINRRLDNLTWRLVGDEKQIEKNKNNIATNATNIATNEEGISGNKTALENQAATISMYEGYLSAHSYYILDLTDRIKALEALDINNRLEELESFKDTYAEKHFPKITSSIKDLQSKIKELEEEIDRLTTEPGESGGGE